MAESVIAYAPFFDEKMDLLKMSLFERAKHNFLRLVTTPRGSDPFDSEYGASPRSYLFEINTNNLPDFIKLDIEAQIAKYEAEFLPYFDLKVEYYKPNVYNKTFIVIEAVLFNLSGNPIRIVVDTARGKDYVINGSGVTN